MGPLRDDGHVCGLETLKAPSIRWCRFHLGAGNDAGLMMSSEDAFIFDRGG